VERSNKQRKINISSSQTGRHTEGWGNLSELTGMREELGKAEWRLSMAEDNVRDLQKKVWMLEYGISDESGSAEEEDEV
jgi:hypothetical protein